MEIKNLNNQFYATNILLKIVLYPIHEESHCSFFKLHKNKNTYKVFKENFI